MDAIHVPAQCGLIPNFLDDLENVRDADEALTLIDRRRLAIAPSSIFSIQQNVTTARDAPSQVLLRRFYTSEAASYPVNGAKRKTQTPWTECLFVHGRVFVGEGEHVLAQHFDDFERMRTYSLRSVINVPLLRNNLCYATFNVFGTREQWRPEQVLGIRLLALAAARWVPFLPELAYSFTTVPARSNAREEEKCNTAPLS